MNGLPDYFKVHTKISMDNYISRANNIIHGVSIYRSCIDLKMFFAASPIISSARITARIFSSFLQNVSKSGGISEVCVHGCHYDTILEHKAIPIGMSRIVS